MVKEFNTPTKCPACKHLMNKIQVEKVVVLEYGSLGLRHTPKFRDNGQGSTTVRCLYCNKVIGHYDANCSWGLFPSSYDY